MLIPLPTPGLNREKVESSDQRLCPAPFNRTGMKKRWPEMAGYSRAHDPGSNRILL